MKQTIFTAILIFVFCFAAFAQANERQSKAIKISEYEEDYGSENVKFAVYDLFKKLQASSNTEGKIKIQAKTNKEIVRQIINIKGHLKFRGFDQTRISFAISNRDKKIIQYWFVPLDENIPDCKDCIIIKAEDFDRLKEFFSETKTKKS